MWYGILYLPPYTIHGSYRIDICMSMCYWLSIIEWPLCRLTLFYRPSAKCEPSLCPKNEWLPQKRFPQKASYPKGANHLLRIVSWNLNEPMRFGGLFRHRNCQLRIWRWMFRDLQPWQVGLKSSVQWHLLCAMRARNKAFHPRRNGHPSRGKKRPPNNHNGEYHNYKYYSHNYHTITNLLN